MHFEYIEDSITANGLGYETKQKYLYQLEMSLERSYLTYKCLWSLHCREITSESRIHFS